MSTPRSLPSQLLHLHAILGAVKSLDRTVDDLREFLAVADPKLVTCARAAELVEDFSELEKLAEAGKVLFAARAADSKSWAVEGHSSPVFWLAEMQKCSFGEAISVFDTSKRLSNLDDTTQALRSGEIAAGQAKEIALAAERDPTSETPLIEAAGQESLKGLRERVRQVLARASSKEEEVARYNRIRASRFLRHWTDHDGAVRLDVKLTADLGGRAVSAISAEADAIFERIRAEGDSEAPQCYRADALVSLLCGEPLTGPASRIEEPDLNHHAETADRACDPGSGSPRKPGGRTDTVVIRVDADSLRRGHARGDELCEIAGIGRVPVATVREILPEAFVKIVIRDSVDVTSVCHVGRLVSAHLRTALEERDPICVAPGCETAHGLEIHHWREDFAESKITNLDSVCRICSRHHDMITYAGFELRGGPGKWELIPPSPPPILDSG
jgi:hypothetical protein